MRRSWLAKRPLTSARRGWAWSQVAADAALPRPANETVAMTSMKALRRDMVFLLERMWTDVACRKPMSACHITSTHGQGQSVADQASPSSIRGRARYIGKHRIRPTSPGSMQHTLSCENTTKDIQLSAVRDRKSTRLNSSHLVISYAVFCLKKQNQQNSSILY